MLDDLLKKLNKKGERDFPVMMADDPDSPCIVADWISTGCMALDAIMGGGLPVGRIIELYGDTSTGKSLIGEQAIASVQQQYPEAVVLYMDTERAASMELFEELGIDISKVVYADPDTIEEVFQLMEDVLTHKAPEQMCFIVWDSIAATTAQQEKDAEYGKATMGKHAQLLSQGLRKFNRLIAKHNACALFINQTRQKIGIMFGDDEATFGGQAVSFYAAIRIRLKRGKKIVVMNGKKKEIIGISTTAQIVKNKVSRPFLEAELPIYFGTGIDDAEATKLYLKELDVITMSGSWSTIVINGKEHRFQGDGWFDIFDKNYDAIQEMVLGNEDTTGS